MKALVLTAFGHLDLTDVPEPAVGPRDVLVRIRASGICGSDVHGLDGSTGRRIPPLIMGHEAAGDIARIGAEVTGWAPGDRVTFDSTISCRACDACRRGLVNLCDRRRVFGVATPEHRQDGTFAEYVAVPQHLLYRLPDGVSYVEGACAEPLSIAVHAVSRSTVTLESSAVVVGAGAVGLLIVGVLRAMGCAGIVALDLDPGRLELARRLGATTTIRAERADVLEGIRAAAGPDGADVAFEAVGIPETVGLAIEATRRGGTVVLVGNVAPVAQLPLQAVVTRQLTIHGSAASCGEFPVSLDMIAAGTVDVRAIIGAVRPLSEGAAWFGRLRSGEAGLVKVVLEP